MERWYLPELLTPYPSPLTSLDNLIDQSFFGLPPSPERRDSHHLFRMVIEKLEPFFRRIVGRQHLTLSKLCLHGVHQIVQCHTALLNPACCNHTIDRLFLRPLNDRSEDRAADQITPIEDLVLSASKPDRQQSILIDAREDRGERMFHEVGAGSLPISSVLVDPLPVQGEVFCQVHIENRRSRVTIRPAHFNLAVDTPWPQDSRVYQIR